MKRISTLCIILCTVLSSFAQTDTTGKKVPEADTIRVGNIIIIRKPGGQKDEVVHNREYRIESRRTTPRNISTNWWIVDLGFANYVDNSSYGSAATNAYAPGSNASWFHLKQGKSVDVNIWVFMQRLNIVKHVVNLKYGLGIELNNYRYKQDVRYDADPPPTVDPPRVIIDNTVDRSYHKDKLAADYLTVPLMLNFNFTPYRRKAFGFSAGVSAGFLYGSRNKTVTSDEGKKKAKDDFELETWKLSYVAELSLGPVRLYGSYAFKSMYERGLDITPYTFGFRFSNW